MAEVATPHTTRPIEVWITEPLTTANRGEIARWLEDHGFAVGVPAEINTVGLYALIVNTRFDGEHGVSLGERIVVNGRTLDVVDHAHYKLWYEPVDTPAGRTEP